MGNFQLAAFLLFLGTIIVKTAEAQKFNFGDLIRFQVRDGPDHYGVALGELDDKGNELFFHKYKGALAGAGHCVIDTLNPNTAQRRRVDNYQDPGHVLTQEEEDAIEARMEECLGYKQGQLGTPCCGFLDLISNNCEHTATYVRYGAAGRVSCLVNSKVLLPEHYPAVCRNWQKEF